MGIEGKMERDEVRLAIRNIRDLPTLPGVATRILEVTQNTESSAMELADIVINDPAVSAKILNLANSSFYGFSQRITTIPQAVVVLGFDMVRSLALGVSVFQSLDRAPGSPSFEWDGFWLHSIGCATAAKNLAREVGIRDEGSLFVAGLLHDLAKILLDTHFRDQYRQVMLRVTRGDGPSCQIELEELGVDHAEIGSWLAFRWKFPDLLVDPIAGHHDLNQVQEGYNREAACVHLANLMTKQAGLGSSYEGSPPDPRAFSLTGLSEGRVDALTDELSGQKEAIEEFFSYLRS